MNEFEATGTVRKEDGILSAETETIYENGKSELDLPKHGEDALESDAPQDNNTEKRFGEYTVDELYALADVYPDEDVMSDIVSESFRIFARQRSGSMGDTYSEYLAMKKAFKQDIPASGKSEKEYVRTHSGFGEAPSRDPSVGLTRRQMEIARNAGMSYREYAFLLESLPDKRIR